MKKFIIPAFLLLPALCSCMKEVVMDAMEDPQVVVECILCDGPVQTLNLIYTQGASRETAPELPEAEAVLTDLTEGKEAGRFTRAADGSWELNYAAIPSHRYRLDVSVPGHETIWAEQEMPEIPSLDAEWDWWREDLPEDAEYRMVHGYVFSVDTLHSPVWFYGMNYPDMDSEGEITENLATDYPDVDRFNENSSEFFSGLTYGSHYFRPSAYPNLDGAAMNHRHYLRFPPREAERTEFLVSGDFRGYMEDKTDFVHSRKRFPELHYFAASDDYDKFLSDAYQLEEISTSSDLSSIFLRDNVYTNIHGATGIFGAMIERTLLWDDDRYWGEGPFILSGFESAIDYSPRGVSAGYSNANWQEHRPFSILHYELCGSDGCPEDWKYGVPKTPHTYYFINPDGSRTYVTEYNEEYSQYASSIYHIENEEQLRDHGLEEFGPVDFTRKSVLAVYTISGLFGPRIPYLVDYSVREDPATGRCMYTLYMAFIMNTYWNQRYVGPLSGYLLNPDISSRVAIVVEKIDESSLSDEDIVLNTNFFYTKDTPAAQRLIEYNILPDLGIDFNREVLY